MKNDFVETLDAIKDAYQEGYKNATEKALEFIKERLNFDDNVWYIAGEATIKDKVIEDFKNYMEGKQL